MHKMIICNLGPISYAEIICNKWMILTGDQTAGKSTVSKALFFFRTIKDDLLSYIIKKTTMLINKDDMPDNLLEAMNTILNEKLIRLYGVAYQMNFNMSLEYIYSDDVVIKISYKKNDHDTLGKILIEYSNEILNFFMRYDNILHKNLTVHTNNSKELVKFELIKLFNDEYDHIYIPAGRSMITLLAMQLNYLYSTMEDAQKRTIDLCTRSFIENIIILRPEFEQGYTGLEISYPLKTRKNNNLLNKAKQLANEILKGTYKYNNGDEYLEFDSKKNIKINFSSSGQQEVVWIINLLYYRLLQGSPTSFIIEEPESHLFPQTQKLVIDYISLVGSAGHNILLTTHSPYILGSINNLIFVNQIPIYKLDMAKKIIDKQYWIDRNSINGWFVKDGVLIDCIDDEIGLIKIELIDEISRSINEDYDNLCNIIADIDNTGY